MILMYHNIGSRAGFNTVSLAALKQHLAFLSDNFELVNMDEYINRLDTNTGKGMATITFDDGYSSFLHMALDELTRYSAHATVYLPVEFMGQTNTWDSTQNHLPIMDAEQVKGALQSKLVTIGAHGMRHRRLGSLLPHEINEEISQSKQALEETFLQPVKHFSFPYGQQKDYNAHAIHALQENGFVSAVSTNYSIYNNALTTYELNRVEVEPRDTFKRFSAKCTNPYHIKYFKQQLKNLLYCARIL